MDDLPEDYTLYCYEDIEIILRDYDHADLLKEAYIGNGKAQKAIVVKIQIGILEFANMSAYKKMDELVEFWQSIVNINQTIIEADHSKSFYLVGPGRIASSIIEISMGKKLYNHCAPDADDFRYGVQCLKLLGMKKEDETYHIARLEGIFDQLI